MQLSSDLFAFVFVDVFEREDQFAIEIAWNEVNEYPWRVLEASLNRAAGRDRIFLPGMKINAIWDFMPERVKASEERAKARREGRSVPATPVLPFETMAERVDGLVEDAVDKLMRYGIPNLERVARKRGVKLLDA